MRKITLKLNLHYYLKGFVETFAYIYVFILFIYYFHLLIQSFVCSSMNLSAYLFDLLCLCIFSCFVHLPIIYLHTSILIHRCIVDKFTEKEETKYENPL